MTDTDCIREWWLAHCLLSNTKIDIFHTCERHGSAVFFCSMLSDANVPFKFKCNKCLKLCPENLITQWKLLNV